MKGEGDKVVSVTPTEGDGGCTRGHGRRFEELRFTRLGICGWPDPSLHTARNTDKWQFIPWKRVAGISGIDDPDEIPEDIPDDVFTNAPEEHTIADEVPA